MTDLEGLRGASGVPLGGNREIESKKAALLGLTTGKYLHVEKVGGQTTYRVNSDSRHALSYTKVAALAQETLSEVSAPNDRAKLVTAIAKITQRLEKEVAKPKNIFKRIFTALFGSSTKSACQKFERMLHLSFLTPTQKKEMLRAIEKNPNMDWEQNLGVLEKFIKTSSNAKTKETTIKAIIDNPKKGFQELNKKLLLERIPKLSTKFEDSVITKMAETADKVE